MRYIAKRVSVIVALFLCCGALATCVQAKKHNGDDTIDSSKSIFITGSDTVEPIMKRLVPEFKAHHPEYKNLNIVIYASDTTNGINDLIDANSSIAMTSRNLRASEIAMAKKKGVTIVPTIIANDGVAIIVNAQNPLNNLSFQQLGEVFSGKIKNWEDLGGEDIPIKILSREQGSGSAAFFNELVLHLPKNSNIDLRPVGDSIGGYAALMNTIGDVTNAIGYVSYGYLQVRRQEKAAANQDYAGDEEEKILNIDGIELTPTTITNGTYKLTRPLYLCIDGKLPNGAIERKLVDFVVSSEGQKTVESLGFDAAKERSSSVVKRTANGGAK